MSFAKYSNEPHVVIMMTTFNGSKFIDEQLQSFCEQTYNNWSLYVSDDGSTDDTLDKLKQFSKKSKNDVIILEGPGRGFAQNFLSMIRNRNIQADYYAFSDQDDVWDREKIKLSVNWLSTIDEKVPAFFCSRTRLIDQHGNEIGFSPLFSKKTTFENSLVQSIAGGNTMLINNAARELLSLVPETTKIVSHDWFSYMVVTGCGGIVNYSPYPTVGYRQHAGNIIGSNKGFKNLFIRLKGLMNGTFSGWNEANIYVLEMYTSKMTERSLKTFDMYKRFINANFIARFYYLMKMKLYRQTVLGSAGLILATLFKRF